MDLKEILQTVSDSDTVPAPEREQIEYIDIGLIDGDPSNFYALIDVDRLAANIETVGLQQPLRVRTSEESPGRVVIVSGHRRRKACELAGLDTVKAEVKELSRDEAIILMVESNLQRSTILPSEKAFAYKMRLEAMKRQAGRPAKDNYSPVGNNFATSSDELADRVGESKNQIFRYIRLTNLLPDLLSKVDEGKIAMRPAVELSYLAENEQQSLLESIESEDCTPSYAQALKMRRFSQEGNLTEEVILSIMEEEKPNQKEQIKISRERIARFFPEGTPREKMEDTIVKALELYRKRERSMER